MIHIHQNAQQYNSVRMNMKHEGIIDVIDFCKRRAYLLRFWNSSGRWALVSLVRLLISCFFFFVLTFVGNPMFWALARLCAVLVTGFIPFFVRSFSMSRKSLGNSMPRKNSFRSSSTLIVALGSLGYAISTFESSHRSQISPAAFNT